MHTQQALSAFDSAVAEVGVRNAKLADELRGAFVRRLAALGSAPDDLRAAAERLVAGFNHVSGIARQWEPDHSSGADRAKWARATEACADVARLLAAAAPQPPAAQQGEAVAPDDMRERIAAAKEAAEDGDTSWCAAILRETLRVLDAQPAAAPQPVAQDDVPPVLVRDLAEIIGVSVPSVCAALLEIGRPPRSTNMAIGGEEAVAVAKRMAAAPAGVVGELVAWRIRQGARVFYVSAEEFTKSSYDYGQMTALYTAPPARQALTDELIDDIAGQDEVDPRGVAQGWVYRRFARAIERAHGIGGKGGADHG